MSKDYEQRISKLEYESKDYATKSEGSRYMLSLTLAVLGFAAFTIIMLLSVILEKLP